VLPVGAEKISAMGHSRPGLANKQVGYIRHTAESGSKFRARMLLGEPICINSNLPGLMSPRLIFLADEAPADAA
jgi:hypothetical protein